MMQRHIQTFFCDDIRHEINGKQSLIGVYGSRLFVPEFPARLARLFLVAKILTPAAKPFTELSITVQKDDDVYAELALDDSALQAAKSAASGDGGNMEDRVHVIQSIFEFSPVEFEAPCILRVRARDENGILRGLGLRIEVGPAAR